MLFSSGNGGWGVVDDYALSCVYGHLRRGQRDEAGNLDDPHTVVVDAEPLLPYPVHLLSVEYLDFLDELVQHPGREFSCAGIFANQGDEHIRGHSLAVLLVNFGSERLDFLCQLLLFVLIPSGHFCKTVIGELAGNIVLIDTLKQPVQFFIAGLQGFQFLLLQLSVDGLCLLGMTNHSLHKLVLKLAGKLSQPSNLTQHHLLQKVYADVMGGSAAPTIALVVGTVEILDVGVPLIEMKVQIVSAVGTDQKAGEHIALPFMGAAFADFAPLLLDLLEDCPLNDRFVDILEDDPVLPVIGKALLVLVRLGIGLEIEDVAAILLKGKDAGDSGAVPHTGTAQFTLSWAIDALLTPVSDGGEDFLLGQFCGDLLCSIALQGHAVNPADYLGCLLIHDPPFRIIRVLFVAVGRRSHRLAGVALDLVADSALLADVAGVPLVEQRLFGKGKDKQAEIQYSCGFVAGWLPKS